MATARALARVAAAGASLLVLVLVAAFVRTRAGHPFDAVDALVAALAAAAAWATLLGLHDGRAALPLGAAALVGAAWAAHALDALAGAGRLLPNHLASELQLGAAAVLLAGAMAAGAWGLGASGRALRVGATLAALPLGVAVSASAWLGLPWAGVAPSPLLAALFATLALLAAWGLCAGLRRPLAALAVGALVAGWLAHAARLLAGVEAGASVALLSYAAPAALALAPLAAALVLAARREPTPRAG